MKLLDIPGVGNRLRERLVESYGSEDAAIDAAVKGDVAGLLEVVGERQALYMVQWAAGKRYGIEPEGFLATDEAVAVHEILVSKMASFAHTSYAKMKMASLFPSKSSELIRERQKLAAASMAWAKKLEGSGIEDHLAQVRLPRERPEKRIRERAILASSTDFLQQLKLRKLDRLIDIHLVETEQEAAEVAQGYRHACMVGERDICPDGVEFAESLEGWYLVPEATLSYFTDNLAVLSSAMGAASILQDADIFRFDHLESIQRQISALSAGEDSESQYLAAAIGGLDRSINDAIDWANRELKQKIESSSVTVDGAEVLRALASGDGARELFEIQMKGIFSGIVREARAKAAKDLNLTGPDAARLGDIFSAEVQYPIALDKQACRVFDADLQRRLASRAMKSKRSLAKGLSDKKEHLARLVADLMEFDFCYAIGSFALSLSMQMPEIVEEPCLGFEKGINQSFEKAEPVSYSLGKTGFCEHEEKTVLLSGVNSGGKTSLLDLICQIVILAQMGMPVPAKSCRLSIFEELYYFGKSRGTLSAGAFETAMRKFAVVESSKRKLVLADELESITEPGASAKIVACLLDELNRLGSVAVFVSHLAEEVLRYSETPVRIDGIEAEGLDQENNLIVRRSPRYGHLAKSTPELILDRLVRTASGKEKEFYSRLLSKFK